jgi:hypothetical protein
MKLTIVVIAIMPVVIDNSTSDPTYRHFLLKNMGDRRDRHHNNRDRRTPSSRFLRARNGERRDHQGLIVMLSNSRG